MKHRFLLNFFVLVCFLSVLDVSAKNGDWADFNRYEQSNRELIGQPNNGRRVVFMGNSITDNWYHFHPDFFNNNGYIGRGISGQSTYQFLVRFREDVVNLHPAIVVINAATNDVAENTHPYNESYTLGNIKSMVEIAESNGIKVILTSTLPALKFNWNTSITDAPQKILSLNAKIKAYAKKKGVPYIDYYKEMVMKGTGALNPSLTKDGVHPTPDGYFIMEKMIKKAITKMLYSEKK